ncbi:site-specific recombinase XerD [Panacagrimonas perspica]|uniref:Site-specific recombinase XerD n=1 Tax=Panacagrimonas perspica TaxID=381431 RepID=A0A4R7PC58_9GAMM|nr:integrase family protein [Panacagrimonas perspica]TDU31302.1 site-specific recombinase XerD [Panacagrimonas perspica]THD02644.1 hypothetical protein B1810_13960 [Panacagrimonas perspica]
MPVISISKKSVEKELFSAKPRLLYDEDLKGFGVRITATNKAYFAEARVGGKTRRVKLGNHGSIAAEQARRQAKVQLGLMAKGEDPAIKRLREKALAVTVEDAFDAFLAERRNLKPTTVDDMRKALRTLAWDSKRIATITPDMCLKRHGELGKASPARANLAFRYLRAILNFAAEKYLQSDGTPVLAHNPVRSLSKRKAWYEVSRRRTLIADPDLRAWFGAVDGLQNRDARDYLLLVLLTGLRRTEALDLTWNDVDLRGGTLTIPDPKNRRPHQLPLSDYVLEILKARDKAKASEFVFGTARGRLSNLRYALAEVEKGAGVEFCVHDLRRTFATVAEKIDTPGYALKRLLNHKNAGDVTEGYIGLDVERLRKPMQAVTDYILSAAGVKPRGTVVGIQTGKGRKSMKQTAA